MAGFLIGILSSLAAVILVAATSYAVGTYIYVRHQRAVKSTLGLSKNQNEVIIAASAMSVRTVTDIGGKTHRLKGSLVDLGEVKAAETLAAFIRQDLLSSKIAATLAQLGFPGRHQTMSVSIESSELFLDRKLSRPTVLLGSGVFNPLVKDLHQDRSVARIVDKTGEDDDPLMFATDGPRMREVLLPGETSTSFFGRERFRLSPKSKDRVEYRDLALVQKIAPYRVDRQTNSGAVTKTFVLAGLGSGGTKAAIHFFVDNFELVQVLDKEHPAGFAVVLGWWTENFSDIPDATSIEILYPYDEKYRRRARARSALDEKVDATNTFHAAPNRMFFFDFDGVLSTIVKDRTAAKPIPGTIDLLRAIIEAGARICILSSRPVDFLREHFSVDSDPELSSLILIGSKGLARYEAGQLYEVPGASKWRSKVEDATRMAEELIAERNLTGVETEPKGLSLSIHYRMNPSRGPQAEAVAEAVAKKFSFSLTEGRMVYELEPDIAISKGTTILGYLPQCDWVLFAGDDGGDIPGFRAINERRDASISAYCVGVVSAEAPSELIELSDIQVPNPEALQDLVRAIVSKTGSE